MRQNSRWDSMPVLDNPLAYPFSSALFLGAIMAGACVALGQRLGAVVAKLRKFVMEPFGKAEEPDDAEVDAIAEMLSRAMMPRMMPMRLEILPDGSRRLVPLYSLDDEIPERDTRPAARALRFIDPDEREDDDPGDGYGPVSEGVPAIISTSNRSGNGGDRYLTRLREGDLMLLMADKFDPERDGDHFGDGFVDSGRRRMKPYLIRGARAAEYWNELRRNAHLS